MRPASTSTRSPPGHPPPRRRRSTRRHAHPHHHSEPGEPPLIGIVGAGAVGTALGVALTRAGWPVHAVASRDADRRERFRAWSPAPARSPRRRRCSTRSSSSSSRSPTTRSRRSPASSGCTAARRWSTPAALLGAEVLEPAMAAGTQIGAFHPLVAFADTERAIAALHGATSRSRATTSSPRCSRTWPRRSARRPVRLAPGAKAAYHAAAVLAAGGFVALLDAIAELGGVAGPRRGRRARDLRPAHRGDARAMPGRSGSVPH